MIEAVDVGHTVSEGARFIARRRIELPVMIFEADFQCRGFYFLLSAFGLHARISHRLVVYRLSIKNLR